jgi:imidazolonepropionase-like amidohydrolase
MDCHRPTRRRIVPAVLLVAAGFLNAAQPGPRILVIDAGQIVDGTGAPALRQARLVIDGDRIVGVGPIDSTPIPDGAERIDLSTRTLVPGLIDLHFHIETDPRLALRQLSHGVTSFRDPGQWEEKFIELRRMIAADGLPAPRIFTAGPHIDGERPAYPADAVVARDADEARRLAERNIEAGASALKIYFRLPLGSARAVIDVCVARRVPCTAHLEVLDAGELVTAGLHGLEHITSIGPSLLPRVAREVYRQAVLADNDARREGRYAMFSRLDLDGPEARAFYEVLRARRPWIDPTLAVFERRATSPAGRPPARTPSAARRRAVVATQVAGFDTMKRLTRRVAREGARIVVGGHSTVPFAERGEAPWREMELLVESGFTALEVIQAATGTAAAFLYRDQDLGTLQPGRLADLVVLTGDPLRDIAEIRTVDRVMANGTWIDVARYRAY